MITLQVARRKAKSSQSSFIIQKDKMLIRGRIIRTLSRELLKGDELLDKINLFN